MYISNDLLIYSLKELESVHPFFGITYLTCKEKSLPVGVSVEFPMSIEETAFLNQYYKPEKRTRKFFKINKIVNKKQFWVEFDYASSGLQTIRTQTFADAFIHDKNSNLWGWVDNYVEVLKQHLKSKIPAYCLAFWILKDTEWSDNPSIGDILDLFLEKFKISINEQNSLFNLKVPPIHRGIYPFSDEPYSWNKISQELNISYPDDLPIEKGGALLSLELKDLGVSKDFKLDLNSRLNIITGDNGLGKSIILESAWWSLTQEWTTFPIYPDNTNRNSKPIIEFSLLKSDERIETYTANFNWRTQDWILDRLEKKTIPGLIIYAKVDGAFAIWDPTRISTEANNENEVLSALNFTRDEVWNGVRINEGNRTKSIFNGLIIDWVNWQNLNNEAFSILKRVLKRLSPPNLDYGDLGVLEPGAIVRIPGESRLVPTIKHPYGEVPILFASAAVKRIIALAYLIVWTWEEHKTSASLKREDLQTKMVIIADEIESHLHPQWQRVILPSLVDVSDDLSDALDVQFLITTHSPLVMASIETFFNETTDKIFHLNLKAAVNGDIEVILENPLFERRGTVDAWLTSDIFELKQPGNIPFEKAIEKAKSLQKEKNPDKNDIKEVSEHLIKLLPPHNTFWIRWNYFAEKNGVDINA